MCSYLRDEVFSFLYIFWYLQGVCAESMEIIRKIKPIELYFYVR